MLRFTKKVAEISKEDAGQSVVIAGWVQSTRVKGKIAFLVLRDGLETIQITCFKPKTEKVFNQIKEVSKESSVIIKGTVKLHEEAPKGIEITPSEMEVTARADSPLPFDPFAEYIDTKKDTRYDWRILDLRHPKNLAYHRLKSSVIYAVSQYMRDEGFTYWVTPNILGQSSEGGGEVFSLDYFGKPAFLAMSPQLHKQAIAGNTGTNYFEITPYFRAEKSRTTRHLVEFTGFDVEMPFVTEKEVWPIAEGIVKTAVEEVRAHTEILELIDTTVQKVPDEFPKITYDTAVEKLESAGVKMEWGDDFSTEQEKELARMIKTPFFVYNFPKSVAKFYVRSVESEPEKAHSFDLIYQHELCSGAWRETRIKHLIHNMQEKGLNPGDFNAYLDFFRYGVAPHAGFGLGIERLMATILQVENIQEVIAFPRTPDRLTP